MKLFKQAQKYGAKVATGAGVLAMTAAAHAGPIDDLFAEIDLTTVAAAVLAIGLLVVGIAMSFKGIDLSKRAVRKV
jgi:hypothetical protein